jgi:lipid-A-disaccharide synthase-like uncharacterized protein
MRKKWEIPTLMVLLLGLGAWLVWAGKNDLYGIHATQGAELVEFRLGNNRGVVEITSLGSNTPSAAHVPPTDADAVRFRLLLRDGFVGPSLTVAEFRDRYGEGTLKGILARGDNFVFRLFNITSWTSLIWAGLGLLGQVAFFGRMFIQWIASERKAQSVVPSMFWWLSLIGGVLLFTYFVWRQDFVGVLGQSTGIVIYARNLRLIAKQRRRELQNAQSGGPNPVA